MHCAVTGGAGFIGSHLVDRLVADGHSVRVIDNFATGREENLAAHRGSACVKVIRADVSDADASFDFSGVDWVFHLAALADIVPSVRDPLSYHRANVDGTAVVLEKCRAAGVRRFIYAASSSCYGIPDAYPTPESAPPRPEYPYALTKWLGEEMVLHWGRVYGLPVSSTRFFNVYGPRARTSGTYGAVFGVFLAQKLAGRPFTVVGDGTQARDFTYVTDVVDALVRVASADAKGEIFNVGTGAPQTIRRLVELLGGDVVFIPKRPGEPNITQADSSKLRTQLGWEPTVSFEQGVLEMLRHIELWRNAPVWTPEAIQAETADWFRNLEKRT